MTKDDLIASARGLVPPARAILDEFCAKREEMAAKVNQEMGRRPDLEKLVGPEGSLMSQDNNRNFSRFMEALMGDFKPEVLVDTALWVFRAYRAHGFQTIYWPANLSTWAETLKAHLSPEAFAAVEPFYEWLIVNVPALVSLTDEASDT